MDRIARSFAVLLSSLVVLSLAVPAAADVPKTMSYQGVLTDGAGGAVPDGSYDLTFSLYTTASGGSPVWSELQSGVQVKGGIFSVLLGSVTALNLDFDVQYWLGVRVGANPELPRIPLTSSPYSLNAAQVRGSANVFPSSGNVGIGTTSPSLLLHVRSNTFEVARFEGTASGSWAMLYLNAQGSGSSPSLAFQRQGLTVGELYCDTGGFVFRSDGVPRFYVDRSSGYVGIGTSSPGEALDLFGGLRLGNTTNANAGTIRWTGSDFEGYDGSGWQSLTSGGGSGLPSGIAGNTLRCTGGSNWVADGNLFNTGNKVIIGIGAPNEALYVTGGNWDLTNTEGDVKIGSDNYRLNIGVATGGGGAGTVGFRVKGGLQRMIFGGGAQEVMQVDSSGTVTVGSGPGVDGRLDVKGSGGTATIDMSQSGDSSVQLPQGAVSSGEILDEPGLASVADPTEKTLSNTWGIVMFRNITVPGPGYILAIATASLWVYGDGNYVTHVYFGLSDNAGTPPANAINFASLPNQVSQLYRMFPGAVHTVFPVSAAGTKSIYLMAKIGTYTTLGKISHARLTLLYIPTSYGTVDLSQAAGE